MTVIPVLQGIYLRNPSLTIEGAFFFFLIFFLILLKFLCFVNNGRSFYDRIDIARGYMTNSELEKAVKEFGRRCSNISRIYRWLFLFICSSCLYSCPICTFNRIWRNRIGTFLLQKLIVLWNEWSSLVFYGGYILIGSLLLSLRTFWISGSVLERVWMVFHW